MALQTGRFARAFTPGGSVGQGGFGQVYRAFSDCEQTWCAMKVIPASLDSENDASDDVWSGKEVFQRLCTLTAPNVMRYHDYWLEGTHPVTPMSDARTRVPSTSFGSAEEFVGGGSGANEVVQSGRWQYSPKAEPPLDPLPSKTLDLLPVSGWQYDDADGFEWASASDDDQDDADEEHPFPSIAPAASEAGCRGQSQGRRRPAALTVLSRGSPKTAHKEPEPKVYLLVKMEYCEGITLHEWLYEPSKRDRMNRVISSCHGMKDCLGVALSLGKQMLEGLAALHGAHIVHRDVKPANILLQADTGRVRIFDFGLARLAPEGAEPDDTRKADDVVLHRERIGSAHSEKSASGSPAGGHGQPYAVGSPGYAAPEQWGLSTAGPVAAPHPSADVFSAGVVLLELLIAARRGPGNLPVWGTAMERAAALQSLRGGTLEMPANMLGLPVSLSILLRRMTHLQASWRPTSSEALETISTALTEVNCGLVAA
mmetsp:Transcript_50085/g.108819  ORF Transcript_50085/g.108819 Transcript_50085/m.108819 type:complete len:484 (+) Transcript_50085:100-1551(+)